MTLIYISHWRFPSEKTMSPLIMKTCEMFAKKGIEVELWIPWRQNRGFSRLDPFEYHGIERNFRIRRIPAFDLTAVLPGNLFFLLMLATFQLSLSFMMLLNADIRRSGKSQIHAEVNQRKSAFPARNNPRKSASIFYFHDARDALVLSFFRRPMFLEIHDFYRSSAGWINKLIFPRMRGLIVTNRLKMDVLKRDFDVPDEKMLHQPNAVDVRMFAVDIQKEEARRILGLPPDKKIILYTGHLFYWKGVDTLLEAARFLSEDKLVYFVGGTDEDIEKFRNKATPMIRTHPNIPNESNKIVGKELSYKIPAKLCPALFVLQNFPKGNLPLRV